MIKGKNLKFGFSTGCFYKFMQPISKAAIKACQEFGFKAIELSVICLDRIDLLDDITKEDVKDFQYVSIHGPSHDDMKELDRKKQGRVLDILQRCYEKLNFNILVLHPGEWIADWEIFNDYSMPIAFENMDWRHKIATDVNSLKEIFKNKKFKMVLDLNHVYTNDSTMNLASDLYDNFKDIIAHYHISGITSDEDCHDPLYRTQKEKIIKAIPDFSLPIIDESVFRDKREATEEAEFLQQALKDHI